jgi:hypothetical protein
MLVDVDLLGVGTDVNKPCENKPRINDITTRNNWNDSKRTRKTVRLPSCLKRLTRFAREAVKQFPQLSLRPASTRSAAVLVIGAREDTQGHM